MSVRRVVRTGGLWFDGVGSYVSIGPKLYLKTFTVTAWIKVVRAIEPSYDNIIGYGTQAGGAYRYGWCIFQSKGGTGVGFIWGYGTAAPGTAAGGICSGLGWHHVAAVKDGLRQILYHNGVVVSDKTFSYDIDYGSSSLKLGYNGNLPWSGIIDDVRIYNRVLSIDEIKRIYERDELIKDGLVLYLDFSEYEGDVAYDKSGYGNHGTIYGARWVVKKHARVLPKAR